MQKGFQNLFPSTGVKKKKKRSVLSPRWTKNHEAHQNFHFAVPIFFSLLSSTRFLYNYTLFQVLIRSSFLLSALSPPASPLASLTILLLLYSLPIFIFLKISSSPTSYPYSYSPMDEHIFLPLSQMLLCKKLLYSNRVKSVTFQVNLAIVKLTERGWRSLAMSFSCP